MRRTTFSVVFFCKKARISKKGKAPIYARITTSGLSTEIYTRCQIEPERWNQRLERSLHRDKVALQINGIVDSYRANILAAYDALIREGRIPDCFTIKERLENPGGTTRLFLAEFSKYCEKRQQEVGTRITQLTANKYHRLLRYMTEYIRQVYGKEDLPLETIDYAYIDGLNTHMQTRHKCKNNGAVNLLCCLKNFILYAIRNEWIEKNPFRFYKMKIDKTNVKVPLTKAELDLLLKRPMPNERLERIRDVFCFCALTGLAFTDVDHLRPEHITTDENGTLWIHKPREKTAVVSRIPLLPHSIRILQKYERDPELRLKGKLLPVPSNQKMNAYRKQKVVFIALGALTNLCDVLRENPASGARIDRVVWYNSRTGPLSRANFETDSAAARYVLASGVPVTVVSANPACPVVVTPALIDSVAAVPNVYARKIAATHRTPPLAKLVGERHLEAWDDLVALWLFAPELFSSRKLSGTVQACELSDKVPAEEVQTRLTAILRGKPDSESRVFYGFPVRHALYAADVVPIIDSAIARHGVSEWRAGVLTNELHGHLGIYATIGVKMGIRAREYFNIGVDDILVTTYAGHNPPISCMNDGLQVGTGASVGHGLITVAENVTPRPEARFTFKNKTVRLVLKPGYADRIRRDVKRGIELYGNLTEPYWQYVRALALQYWLDFDRHEIFDMYVGENTP